MSYIYKQFARLIAKWPLEDGKCVDRQFRFHLERDLVKAFKIECKDGKVTEPIVENPVLCERQYKGIF